MSFSKRSLLKASRSCSRVSLRTEATTSAAVDSAGPSNETSSKPAKPSKPSPKSRSPLPQLKVGLVLSRNPLLQKTPHPLEKAYHDHSFKLRHALSNPVPEDFYFRPGSLPERRFQQAQHDFVVATYGARIAGKAPAVGDIPPERPLDEVDRLKWVKEDEARGEQSLERLPEQELFCLTQDKNSGKWGLPTVLASGKAPLHEVIESELTGVGGAFDGTGMDTWLVTKKPIGYINENGQRTFFLRSHILAGEPKLSSGAIWKSWAWLTKEEVHTRLTAQGDKELWKGIRNMFGVSSTTETPLKVELLSEEDDILD